jgi:hypothetical protein
VPSGVSRSFTPTSASRRGSSRDVTAAPDDHVFTHLRAAGLAALADIGFLGLTNPEVNR